MRILIVDALPATHGRLRQRLTEWGHDVFAAETTSQAWLLLRADEFDAVIYRWHTADSGELDLVTKIRSGLSETYLYTLVLSDSADVNGIVAALEAGADDVLTKPFSGRELRARLRSAERIATMGRALAETNRQMRADLDAGARFARSLLPKPLQTPFAVDYRHQPATSVSGDAFGYHWIDADNLALYLLDASGHGLDAALLAVSIMNVLRSETLPGTNFRKPNEVLRGLNRAFPMEDYGDKCFTIWYGVIGRVSRKLHWAGGGHPPAILIPPKGDALQLNSTGPVMGAFNFDYPVQTCTAAPRSRLYLYSDGVSEARLSPGEHRSTEDFITLLQTFPDDGAVLDAVLADLQTLSAGRPLADDVSILEVRF